MGTPKVGAHDALLRTVVESRRRTLLPLDDVLGCPRESIPALSRSALHRCPVRRGISRLPRDEGKASKRKRFAGTAIGHVHIDACELGPPENRGRHAAVEAIFGGHIFDRVCREHGIEHRLAKPYHPWTNGQAERMNRTVKEATIKAFHYPDLDALKAHILAFVTAHNSAKHLKALRWRTPLQAICDAWTEDPTIFKVNPHHLTPGPNT